MATSTQIAMRTSILVALFLLSTRSTLAAESPTQAKEGPPDLPKRTPLLVEGLDAERLASGEEISFSRCHSGVLGGSILRSGGVHVEVAEEWPACGLVF